MVSALSVVFEKPLSHIETAGFDLMVLKESQISLTDLRVRIVQTYHKMVRNMQKLVLGVAVDPDAGPVVLRNIGEMLQLVHEYGEHVVHVQRHVTEGFSQIRKCGENERIDIPVLWPGVVELVGSEQVGCQ